VRQQNSGAVEDFILPYSAVYLRIQNWKNYWNRSTFAKVIVKIKVAPFFMAHGVVIAVIVCRRYFLINKSHAIAGTSARECSRPLPVMGGLGSSHWPKWGLVMAERSCLPWTRGQVGPMCRNMLIPAYHLLWTSSEFVVCEYSAT